MITQRFNAGQESPHYWPCYNNYIRDTFHSTPQAERVCDNNIIAFSRGDAEIQLFRVKLSYKSVKVNATMSKVIMGNDGFASD